MTRCVRALSRTGTSSPGNRAVVVFPHAGGSPRSYASWSAELPAGTDLYGVTYPGRDQLLDEPAPGTLVELARDVAAELKPIVQASGSVVMFGHSMGACVAFEATRSLEKWGVPVTALVVSGSEAPHLAHVGHLDHRGGGERTWHRACDDDLVRHVGELDARSRQVLAVAELRQMFLPTIRDDYRLIENYRAEPDPKVSCPVHVLFGESDPEVIPARAVAWADCTRADWHVRPFSGDHFYLAVHTARVVGYLAEILN